METETFILGLSKDPVNPTKVPPAIAAVMAVCQRAHSFVSYPRVQDVVDPPAKMGSHATVAVVMQEIAEERVESGRG